MSYTPTTWKSGDTVTSAKLNKIEQGIANNILFVNVNWEETEDNQDIGTLDKTWEEIRDAEIAILRDFQISEDDWPDVTFWSFVTAATYGESLAGGYYYIQAGEYEFKCSSPNGYPQVYGTDEDDDNVTK